MRTSIFRLIFLLWVGIAGAASITPAQQRPSSLDEATVAKRNATEQELESIAIIDRKVMVAMRDGKRMATDIYRPKDTTKKYPVIFVRTPYNFNYWDVANGVPRDMSTELDAVKRGYAYVEMNERGHFFSEGNYDILGPRNRMVMTLFRGSPSRSGPMPRWAPSDVPRRRNGNWESRRSEIKPTRP
jgi:hypothetical protein